MFILIAFLTNKVKKKSKIWDGQVFDKKVAKKSKRIYTDKSHYYYKEYLLYTVCIRDDSGKVHEISIEDDDTVFNYFKVSDKVRHHGGLILMKNMIKFKVK